jgi:formylglycine-generating enzyme required for sulfatase activity
VNPWLALWCVGEGRAVSEATQREVENRSIAALDDGRLVARRRAVEALSRMRNDRVTEPLLRAAGDPDQEIASLALQALGQRGKGVQARAVKALENHDSWLGVLRYALAYPDEALCLKALRLAADDADRDLLERLSSILESALGFSVVWVPGEPFLMGSDPEKDTGSRDSEFPQHQVTLPGYWIGRTLVTVAQYRAFVEESGYAIAHQGSLEGPQDHPVVSVSWHDGLAYCRWLRERSGLPVTLPSEAEWEKAARGTDGRIYPWGDQAPTQSLCNYDDNEGNTTPVGRYSPRGDSPCCCADMAGNAWEWTRSLWGSDLMEPEFGYPYDPQDGRENLVAGDNVLRVLRGGAFNDDARLVRCACRDRSLPDLYDWDGGFRVVVSPFL